MKEIDVFFQVPITTQPVLRTTCTTVRMKLNVYPICLPVMETVTVPMAAMKACHSVLVREIPIQCSPF